MLKTVFTNGCFDILHVGHLKVLMAARALGDRLIVGLNSDDSTRRLKGSGRPIIPYDQRKKLLLELECVDHVTGFDEDTPLWLIETIKPDIVVKGGDYKPENVVGYGIAKRIVIVPLYKNVSTSNIIERIRNENV